MCLWDLRIHLREDRKGKEGEGKGIVMCRRRRRIRLLTLPHGGDEGTV